MTQKLSTLIRKAARDVERYRKGDTNRHKYSCLALSESLQEDWLNIYDEIREEYAWLFSPSIFDNTGFWLDRATTLLDCERQDWRVTALSFYAAMVEAEGY